jgi:hypothetical protein
LHVVLRIKVSAARAREHDGRGDANSQPKGCAGEGRLSAVCHLLLGCQHMALKIATPAVVSVTICHVSDNDIRIINNLPRGHPRASVGQVIVFRGLPSAEGAG